MANMNLKKSTIFMLASEDMEKRKCWGCRKNKTVKFRDTATGGYLCTGCMPDVYWAGKVLSDVDGSRDPIPGECSNEDNR